MNLIRKRKEACLFRLLIFVSYDCCFKYIMIFFMLSYGHIWLIQIFQFYSILFYIQQHLLIINDRPLINVCKKKITLYAFYPRRAFADLPSSQECFKRKILKPVMYKYRNTFYKRPLYNSS